MSLLPGFEFLAVRFTCLQLETLSLEFSLGLLDLLLEVDNALSQARDIWVLNRIFIELGSERGVVLSQVFILTTEDRVLVL